MHWIGVGPEPLVRAKPLQDVRLGRPQSEYVAESAVAVGLFDHVGREPVLFKQLRTRQPRIEYLGQRDPVR